MTPTFQIGDPVVFADANGKELGCGVITGQMEEPHPKLRKELGNLNYVLGSNWGHWLHDAHLKRKAVE